MKTFDVFFFNDDTDICSECVDKPRVINAKLDFYNDMLEMGGRVFGKYVKDCTAIECECPNGHKCRPRPLTIINGHNICSICTGTDPISIANRFYKSITDMKGAVIGIYKKDNIHVECRCKYGHVCFPKPTNIRGGRGMCLPCSGKHPLLAEMLFRRIIAERGGTVIGKYLRSSTTIECECPLGHKCFTALNYIQNGKGMCRTCSGKDPAVAAKKFDENIKTQGGTVLEEYQRRGDPVKCKCSVGHICYPVPDRIRGGQGMCSLCGFLKSEPLCRQIFEEILAYEMPKKRPAWLLWKNNKPLELDGYNEEHMIAFEYQGMQHDKYIPHFHRNGIDDFLSQKERDAFKAKICLERGVKLLYVPHIYTYKEPEAMRTYIKSILIDYISLKI